MGTLDPLFLKQYWSISDPPPPPSKKNTYPVYPSLCVYQVIPLSHSAMTNKCANGIIFPSKSSLTVTTLNTRERVVETIGGASIGLECLPGISTKKKECVSG